MKKLRNKVYITGIGCSGPIGDSPAQFWETLFKKSYQKKASYDFDDNDKFDTLLKYQEHYINMCTDAIRGAFADARPECSAKKGLIIVGTGMGLADAYLYTEELPNNYLTSLKGRLKVCLEESNIAGSDIVIMANACCAAAQAVAYGSDLICCGKYDFVVAGGTEARSFITDSGFLRLNSIDLDKCKPFDKDRKGIYPGEGAAFFVLEKQRHDAYCEILGQAVTSDAYHIVAPEPTGKQAMLAASKALKRSGITGGQIDAVIAHGTGTKLNDAVEAYILEKIFPNTDITAPKGMIGHTGGASGAFGLLAAIGLMQYQEIPPVEHLKCLDDQMHINIVSGKSKHKKIENVAIDCFAFGGTNVVTICSRRQKLSNVRCKCKKTYT